jgi:phage terminase large subunit
MNPNSVPLQNGTIELPYNFVPRGYQISILSQVPKHYNRGAFVWHRRAGKDCSAWNKLIKEAVKKPAIYYYFFPTYKMGRKIIWEAKDPATGLSFLDYIPKPLLKSKNDTEMKLVIASANMNESIIRIVGTDDYDSIVGTPPYGCVFSEYSLQDPRAWDYIRPILAENHGWAIFLFTPRGKNHGYDLYEMAKQSPDWFVETKTVDDTFRNDGTPVITKEAIEKERSEGVLEEIIQQEYFVSFSGYIEGSYYSKQFIDARKDGRVCKLPFVPTIEVDTFWDLGVDDSMSIWFLQVVGKEYRFIDYYEDTGYGLEHYAKVLKGKPYVYGNHYMPHDANVREMSTGVVAMSRKEVAEGLGISPIQIVPRVHNIDVLIQVQIPAVRNILPQCWFDITKCAKGIQALEGYRAEYDEEKEVLGSRPVHDKYSHGADAFRTFAVGYVPKRKKDRSVSSMMDRRSERRYEVRL